MREQKTRNEWMGERKMGTEAREWAHLQNYIFYLGSRAAISLHINCPNVHVFVFSSFFLSFSISCSSLLTPPPQKHQQHHHFFWHWISSGCSQKISTAAVNVINTNRYLLWILEGNNVISVWLAPIGMGTLNESQRRKMREEVAKHTHTQRKREMK